MNTGDVILAYVILVVFFLVYSFTYLVVQKTTVAKNWNKYNKMCSLLSNANSNIMIILLTLLNLRFTTII